MNKGIVFLGMGFELVAMCMGGLYLGETVKAHYGLETPVSAYMILAMLIAWFVHLFYLLRKFQKEAEDDISGNSP